jgi:hypothetical protein
MHELRAPKPPAAAPPPQPQPRTAANAPKSTPINLAVSALLNERSSAVPASSFKAPVKRTHSDPENPPITADTTQQTAGPDSSQPLNLPQQQSSRSLVRESSGNSGTTLSLTPGRSTAVAAQAGAGSAHGPPGPPPPPPPPASGLASISSAGSGSARRLAGAPAPPSLFAAASGGSLKQSPMGAVAASALQSASSVKGVAPPVVQSTGQELRRKPSRTSATSAATSATGVGAQFAGIGSGTPAASSFVGTAPSVASTHTGAYGGAPASLAAQLREAILARNALEAQLKSLAEENTRVQQGLAEAQVSHHHPLIWF